LARSGVVTIDERLCKTCGICISFCPTDVLAAKEPLMKAVVKAPERCTACCLCELYCPDWAITVIPNGDEGGRQR